jgi:hypothetical protein
MKFQQIVASINDAFFRLESFMNGIRNEYQYFGFNEAFTTLFIEAKKPENFTYSNCLLVGQYWKLTEQIRVDYDKADFKNTEAYDNEMFCKDCEEITHLNWERIEEFDEFTTPDEIAEYERKRSITDVLGLQAVQPPQKETEQKPLVIKPVLKPEAAQKVFDIIKDFFNPEQQNELKRTLETGNDTSQHLVFLDNGNRLADAFKQLKKADVIIGCEQKELESWIQRNFKFRHRKQTKEFRLRYLNDIISTNKDKCQKPILNTTINRATGEISITKV